jgi:hypothetical protein
VRIAYQKAVLGLLLAVLLGLLAAFALHEPGDDGHDHDREACEVCRFFVHSAVDTVGRPFVVTKAEPVPVPPLPRPRLESREPTCFRARAPPSAIR